MNHTVTEHKLSGGGKGLVVHVANTPVVNIVIRFNSGFQFAPKDKYELSHVLEHLMGCGSKTYPEPSQFKIEVERNGAYRNAFTTETVNGYVIECAPFELNRILDLLVEYMARPIFPPEAVPTELSNVREELKRFTTQFGAVCSVNLDEKAFPEEDLNFQARIDQLDSINRDDVVSYYQNTHTQGNARFYLAGDFPDGGKDVVAKIDKAISGLAEGERLEGARQVGLEVPNPIVQTEDIKQIYYQLASFGQELALPERRALLLMRMVLCGGHASRVYGEARRRGIAYHVSMPTGTGKARSSFGLAGYVTPDNAKELFELAATEVARLRGGDLDEDSLTAAKDLVIGSTTRSYQTAEDMLRWYTGPYDNEDRILDFQEYLDMTRQVTVDEVVAVARKMASLQRHGFSLVGPVDDKLAGEYASILEPIWKA